MEYVFVPALKNPSKSVLIIDNASCHRKNANYDIADEYEFRAIFSRPILPI
ncbi:MAG: hypothetical protein LBL35_00810 [Clostridiales bacterium]|nr:hypothetical protein [Clostridiales bacterium]